MKAWLELKSHRGSLYCGVVWLLVRQTMTTLRYANRAKNIKNKPKINEDPKDALLRQFQDEIARLQSMLGDGGDGGGGGGGGGGGSMDMDQLVKMKEDTERAEAEKEEMKQLLERERKEREMINAQLAALEAKLVSGGQGGGHMPMPDGPTSPVSKPHAIEVATPVVGGGGSNGEPESPGTKMDEVHQHQRQKASEEEKLYFDEEFSSLQV